MNSKYLNNIGLIRVLACIAVFLYHLNLLRGGYLAVCIFFVISGYFTCITSLNKTKFSFKEYYFKKLKNIYLPLLITVFITTGVITLFKEINWYNLKPEVTSIILGYNNYWQLNTNMDYFSSHSSSPFMHLWYMGIILQFDLFFPFIYLIFKKLGDKISRIIPCVYTILLILVTTYLFYLSALSNNFMLTYYNTLTRIFSLLFGVALAFISHYYKDRKLLLFKNNILNNIIFYFYLIILLVLSIFIESTSKYFVLSMLLTTFITTRLISYGKETSKKELSIVDKIIKSISNVSYEIYLIQYPIIFLFQYIKLNLYLEITLIILITVLLSYLLKFALDFKNKKFQLLHITTIILFIIPTIFGMYKYIISKDYTEEMNILEDNLAMNSIIVEQRKIKYLEKLQQEQTVWEETMTKLQAGEEALKGIVTNLSIVGIGDSVMLGAVNELYESFPNGYFDAAVSRTAYKAPGILKNLANSGILGDVLLFNLGTNGDCDEQTKNQIIQLAGNRKIFWVNVTNDHEVGINNELYNLSTRYNNIHIIDWNSASINHPEYFIADHIHLTEIGKKAYINTIYNAIYNEYLNEYNMKKQAILDEFDKNQKQKITFIGNSLLINAYSHIENQFPDSEIITNSNYNFKLIEKELTKKINTNSLSYRVVLVFDKNSNLTIREYKKIIDLLSEYELYIVSSNHDLNKLEGNVKIIDLKKELNNNKEYLMVDKIHLTKKGNERLKELLIESLKK